MVLLHVEVGVTIAEGNGIGLIDIGVQVGNTRTGDAHVVSQTEVTAHTEVVLQAGGGNEASIAGREVLTIAEMIFHILPSVFVAQSCLSTKVSEVTGILAIACEDGILVFVVAAAGGIIDILQIVLRIRSGIVELELTTEAQGLTSTEGHRIVELEDVAQGLVQIL